MCRMSHTNNVCKSEQGVGILEGTVGFFEKLKNLQALRMDRGSSSLKFRAVIIELV